MYLRDFEPKFCDIEEVNVNTKFKFVETIRQSVRYNINKVHKMIKKKELVPIVNDNE